MSLYNVRPITYCQQVTGVWALKIINSLNTNFYYYLETFGGQNYNQYLNIVHIFNTGVN
jgi:hypothetical protein